MKRQTVETCRRTIDMHDSDATQIQGGKRFFKRRAILKHDDRRLDQRKDMAQLRVVLADE